MSSGGRQEEPRASFSPNGRLGTTFRPSSVARQLLFQAATNGCAPANNCSDLIIPYDGLFINSAWAPVDSKSAATIGRRARSAHSLLPVVLLPQGAQSWRNGALTFAPSSRVSQNYDVHQFSVRSACRRIRARRADTAGLPKNAQGWLTKKKRKRAESGSLVPGGQARRGALLLRRRPPGDGRASAGWAPEYLYSISPHPRDAALVSRSKRRETQELGLIYAFRRRKTIVRDSHLRQHIGAFTHHCASPSVQPSSSVAG